MNSGSSHQTGREGVRPAPQLKSPREIGLMREAGRVVAKALDRVRSLTVPGVTTAELEEAVAAIFKEHDAVPLFLDYPNAKRGKPAFPACICSSLNEAVVHGIPNRRPLREGDIISIDTGCRVNGWCGDAAVTLPVGPVGPDAQRLLDVTRETLDLAIRALARAKTWSEVASLMERYVRSQKMSVVEQFVGHGIGRNMHEEPQVPNFVNADLRKKDFAIEPGLVLAIEPMVTLGTKNVEVINDHWTVVTKDRRLAAHFEHTVAITVDGPLILTSLED
ncbi:MAG: type I methionyl aminopeptidase [Isosphaeraceae bacterium]|nr:type I methionyl aminopeptidase [Isosphaeraceae bacterium]